MPCQESENFHEKNKIGQKRRRQKKKIKFPNRLQLYIGKSRARDATVNNGLLRQPEQPANRDNEGPVEREVD